MKLTALFLLLSSISFAQSNDRYDAVFNSLGANPNLPGFAVLIRKDGKTIYQLTEGIRDLRSKAPITPTTDFRLASCTKQFTAMAIMLLVHDGKLKYETTLTKIFPDFPAYGSRITIRNLLNHTSGLPDYEDLMDLPENKKNNWSETHQITDDEVLALLKQTTTSQKGGTLKFAPGTQWSYSNSGYVVLGAIVAKVSGMSFPDFLRKRIFEPLKMTHTLAFVNGENKVPERAYGHSKRDDHFAETDQSATSATLGDGGVYSNLEDLAKWDDALTHHTRLSEAEMRAALQPFKLPSGQLPKWSGDSGDEDPQHGKPVEYGFGWYLDPLRVEQKNAPFVDGGVSHERMWHYGDTVGFKSAIMRFPKDGVTIIVLANRSDVDPAATANKFADAYFQK